MVLKRDLRSFLGGMIHISGFFERGRGITKEWSLTIATSFVLGVVTN